MLTSCKLTGSAADVAAYHTSEENYYFSQGGEGLLPFEGNGKAPGHVFVHGGLSHRLGFAAGQAVSAVQLERLLSGKDAYGREVGRAYKVMGIDLTFSAPKSVSIAALLTDRNPNIMAAHDHAVRETMAEIERHASGTRLYIDKQIKPVKTGNLVYVTVHDGFNRDHDPHLHTHVVVMNMTEIGGKVMTLDGRQIMARDFNKVWGAMYRAKLACHLKEAGYSISYTKKGELRLDSVSLELEREFSTRRAQIAAAKGAGERDFDAWRKTRKGKDHEVNKAQVLADWQARLARHAEKTVDQNRQAALSEREAWFREATWSVEAKQELAGERGESEAARWQVAARRATEHQARASPHALITEYLTELARGEAWEPITYTAAEQRLHEQAKLGNLLATDDGCFTTWELARADRECVQQDKAATTGLAMDRASAASGVAAYRQAQLAAGRRGLSGLQAEAAAGILSAASGTVIVQGDAGSGKTTMLKAVNDLATASGWEVAGVAVQGVAARKLQKESGIESMTLASYLAREQAPAGTATPASRGPRLVVVDESSMLGSRELAALLHNATEHKDKVVLVGDRNQIQSVGAGKPFDRLVESAKQSGQLQSLCENHRQRDPKLRQAVDLARGGRMRESLDLLNENHKIQEIEDAASRRAAVAKLYSSDTLIVTGSRKSREELNLLIRGELVRKGELSGHRAYNLAWTDEDGAPQSVKREFAAGERVVFLRNEYKAYDVRNGEVGSVTKTGENTLGMRLADGRQIELDLARYGALDYGYALTTYKSQGQTYDKVVVEADTSTPVLQDQRNTYVQITRAREDVRIITDDFFELRDQAGVLSVKADTNDLEISLSDARRMERRAREAALSVRARQEACAKAIQVPPRVEAAGLQPSNSAVQAPGQSAPEVEAAAAEIKRRLATEAAKAHEEAAKAARNLAKARTAEKDAGRAEAGAYAWHLEAVSSERSADESVRKARFWEKTAALTAQKEARQQAAASSEAVGEARERAGEERLRVRDAQARSHEAQARAAAAARRNNFQGTPETVIKAAKAVLEVKLAARELEAARTAEQKARREFDDSRSRYDSVKQAWHESRGRVSHADELVRKALYWEKAKAQAAQKEAQRGQDDVTKMLREVKLARENALAREQAAGDLVKAAQTTLVAAKSRAAEVARINALEATQEALRAKADLTPAEQQRVAKYLSRAAGAEILRDCDNPQQAIAAGLIACGTRSAEEATKGMEKFAAEKVVDAVERQQQAEQDRHRSRGHERGWEHTL